MLLIFVEEAVEGLGREVQGFGYEGGEVDGEVGHLPDIGFESWTEAGEGGRVGPLVGGEEVVVEGVDGFGERMGG